MSASIGFANTPEPPYYAVIFTSKRAHDDARGYAVIADRMSNSVRAIVDSWASRAPAALMASASR